MTYLDSFIISRAEDKIKNEKLLASTVIDLQPTTFSKIIETIIASDYMEPYPEARKLMQSRWERCNVPTDRQQGFLSSSDSNDSDNEEQTRNQKEDLSSQHDIFQTQSMKEEDSLNRILTEVEELKIRNK